MSFDVNVFLKRSRLPSLEQWNAKLEELEFDLQLDKDIDPETHSGFFPAHSEVHGPAGFDYSFDELDPEDQAEHTGGGEPPDAYAYFSADDEDQLDAALAAAVALVRCCGGVLVDTYSDTAYPDDEDLERCLDEIPLGFSGE